MEALLTVDDLKVHFPIKKGLLSRTVGYVYAVDGVSLTLRKGETIGLVGESGCGKTTTGMAIFLAVSENVSGLRGKQEALRKSLLWLRHPDGFCGNVTTKGNAYCRKTGHPGVLWFPGTAWGPDAWRLGLRCVINTVCTRGGASHRCVPGQSPGTRCMSRLEFSFHVRLISFGDLAAGYVAAMDEDADAAVE